MDSERNSQPFNLFSLSSSTFCQASDIISFLHAPPQPPAPFSCRLLWRFRLFCIRNRSAFRCYLANRILRVAVSQSRGHKLCDLPKRSQQVLMSVEDLTFIITAKNSAGQPTWPLSMSDPSLRIPALTTYPSTLFLLGSSLCVGITTGFSSIRISRTARRS